MALMIPLLAILKSEMPQSAVPILVPDEPASKNSARSALAYMIIFTQIVFQNLSLPALNARILYLIKNKTNPLADFCYHAKSTLAPRVAI